MSEGRVIAVFAEDSFEAVFTKPTLLEARAFSEGVSVGSGYYGAGSCTGYVLPDDQASMVLDEEPAEVSRCVRAMIGTDPGKESP